MGKDGYKIFVPESHIDCSLSDFDWAGRSILKPMVMDLLNDKRDKGLILIGDAGIGKTYLMVSMFRKWIEKGKEIGTDVIYLEWCEFIQNILACMPSGLMPENTITGLSMKICLMDDIRPVWSGRIWKDILKKLIEKMYEKSGTLILSTNADSVDELIKRWDLEDYWCSRLFSCADVVKMKGKDRRLE